MEGIVSILDPLHYAQIERIWKELEIECGLCGIGITPIPHFSWQVAGNYDQQQLAPILRRMARSIKPFTVTISGLGIFSGENPVLYLALVKDELLLRLHKRIWERAKGTAEELSPFYAPQAWVPHITLAHGDINKENLACAIRLAGFQSFDWRIPIDNLALISQSENASHQASLHYKFGE